MKIGTYELRDLFSHSARLRYFSTNPSDQDTLAFFALPAYYAKQVLWHSRMSVRPSVHLSVPSMQSSGGRRVCC